MKKGYVKPQIAVMEMAVEASILVSSPSISVDTSKEYGNGSVQQRIGRPTSLLGDDDVDE